MDFKKDAEMLSDNRLEGAINYHEKNLKMYEDLRRSNPAFLKEEDVREAYINLYALYLERMQRNK